MLLSVKFLGDVREEIADLARISMLLQPLLARTNPCYDGGPCVDCWQALGAGYCADSMLGTYAGLDQIYTGEPSAPTDPRVTLPIRRHV